MIFKVIIERRKRDANGMIKYGETECKVVVVQNERELKFEVLSILQDKGKYDETVIRDIHNISSLSIKYDETHF